MRHDPALHNPYTLAENCLVN